MGAVHVADSAAVAQVPRLEHLVTIAPNTWSLGSTISLRQQ